MSEDREMFCSFCGKSSYDAKHFVMQGDVAICDMCVGACAAIMAEQDRKDSEDSVPTGQEGQLHHSKSRNGRGLRGHL